METIELTPGDVGRINASIKFAQEQHEALAAISVGDECKEHLFAAKDARRVWDKLQSANKFGGTYSLSWSNR